MMRSQSLRKMHEANTPKEILNKATRQIRCCAISCGVCPVIYAIVICAVYWSWKIKADDYDDKVQNWQGDISAFDSCGGIADVTTNADGSFDSSFIDTKWSVVLSFNAIFYMFHCVLTLFIMIGSHDALWPMCMMGGAGHCVGSCVHLACIIVTGVFRFNAEGERCAESK